jgi:hypothetical protein
MRAATLSRLLAPSFTVMAVAAGVQIATGAGAALRAIVVGVVLSSMSRTNEAGSDRREGRDRAGDWRGPVLRAGAVRDGPAVRGHPDRVDHLTVQDDRLVFVTIPLAVTGRPWITGEAARWSWPRACSRSPAWSPSRSARDSGSPSPRSSVAVRGNRDHRRVRLLRERLARIQDRRRGGDRCGCRGADCIAGVRIPGADRC